MVDVLVQNRGRGKTAALIEAVKEALLAGNSCFIVVPTEQHAREMWRRCVDTSPSLIRELRSNNLRVVTMGSVERGDLRGCHGVVFVDDAQSMEEGVYAIDLQFIGPVCLVTASPYPSMFWQASAVVAYVSNLVADMLESYITHG